MKRKFDYNEDEILNENIVPNYSSPYITEVNVPVKVKLYYGGGGDIKIASSVSGKVYYFKAGTPTEVDEKDAEEFLKLKKMGGCCGRPHEINLFGMA